MNLAEYCTQINRETGAVVHIETWGHHAFYLMESLKIPHEIGTHYGGYCRWFRSNNGFPICRKNKLRSREIARKGREFCGICPNGVWEMAIPVLFEEYKPITVYLGHLSVPDIPLQSINGNTYSGKPLTPLTPEKKKKLRHYGRFLAQFIKFELINYVEDKKYQTKQRPVDFYLQSCDSFIDNRYHENISLGQLSEELNVNTNYLGEIIKTETGKSFRQLLTEKRLHSASLRLVLEASSISEIAYDCGFSDSNYFCKLFSAKFGISPLKYRKQQRSGQRQNAP